MNLISISSLFELSYFTYNCFHFFYENEQELLTKMKIINFLNVIFKCNFNMYQLTLNIYEIFIKGS